MSIILAILALGFIILFHEFGHFLAAKAFGVGVLEFSLGMGPRLFSRVWRNTRYSIKLLPIGGSCAMLGEDEAGSGDFSTPKEKTDAKQKRSLRAHAELVETLGQEASESASVETLPAAGETAVPQTGAARSDRRTADAEPEHVVSAGGNGAGAEHAGFASAEAEDKFADFDGVVFRRDELAARNFQNKPAWQHFVICIAGVAFNFLLAFLLAMFVILFAGYDRASVISLDPAAPAAQSGLQPGDELTGIIGQDGSFHAVRTYRDVNLFMLVNAAELDGTRTLGVTYLRDGKEQTALFLPYLSPEQNRYMLGITFNAAREAVHSPLALVQDSAWELRYNITATIESLKMLFGGRVKSNEVMGPVGTVAVIGDTVQQSSQFGLLNMALVLANLCVLLSANLGVMNLLPIPALDGGRLLFILAEMVTRRRLNPNLEAGINAAGMVLLLCLMALIMGNDVKNLITGVY